MPEPGYSNPNGVTLNVPFFWAIADNLDATFYQYVMSNRGYPRGGSLSGQNSKGAVMADYLFKDMLGEEKIQVGT